MHESALDRPEKVRTFSRTHAPSFFAGCVANLPTHHPLPSFRRLWAPRDPQVFLGLARARAVEWRRRASDPPTSWGASGRDTGGAASGRRKTSDFGLRNCYIEKAADEPKKHVGMIDDGHADPMLRRYIFAPARAPRADITYTLARSGGEVLLSVMGL